MKNILKASLLSSVFALAACGKQEQPVGTEVTLDNGTKITVPTGIHSGLTMTEHDNPHTNIRDVAKQACEMVFEARGQNTESCVMNTIDRRGGQNLSQAYRFDCERKNIGGVLSPVCRPR